MSHEGVLPEDWINGHVARLDNVEGDIDAIAQRIAHIRTWTYVANRPNWLADSVGWQEKTRAIEDHLSDALHEKLTQRFVDRRTSVLMRRLREDEEFAATVDGEGEVLVEGEYVGRLQGFSFVPDPRAVGIHGRALRAAALKGLAGEIAARAHALTNAPEAAITLSEHGRLWWNGGIVATLKKGHDPLAPQVELHADDLLPSSSRERASERLEEWLAHHIAKILAPLLAVQVELKKELQVKADTVASPTAVVEPAADVAESSEPAENSAPVEGSDDAESDALEAPVAAEETSASEEPAPAADVQLFASPLQGSSRGLAFQIYENLGSVSRQAATRERHFHALVAQGIGMALHELATNASKYGALSNTVGRVHITWQLADVPATFTIRWLEEGGPKVVPPTRQGFGKMVIVQMVERAVDGVVDVDYRESGLSWKLCSPIADTIERGSTNAPAQSAR